MKKNPNLSLKRVLVCTFWLNGKQWRKFSEFFAGNPKGILTENDLQYDEKTQDGGPGGHAVVAVRAELNCLVLMNSWVQSGVIVDFLELRMVVY